MKLKAIPLSLLVVATLLPSEATAQTQGRVIPAETVARNVALVNRGYDWHQSLETARTEAARTNKMIFFLQTVGDLDGGL